MPNFTFKISPVKPVETLPYRPSMSMMDYLSQRGIDTGIYTPKSDDATVAGGLSHILAPVINITNGDYTVRVFEDGAWRERDRALTFAAAKLLQSEVLADGSRLDPIVQPYMAHPDIGSKDFDVNVFAKDLIDEGIVEAREDSDTSEMILWDTELNRPFQPVVRDVRFNSTTSLNRVVSALSSRAVFLKPYEEFDLHPEILASPTWYLNLNTGEFMDPDSTLLLTRSLPNAMEKPSFEKHFKGSRFERFLHEVLDGPEIGFLQRAFGQALYRRTLEHIIIVLSGKGRNGKGILLDAISNVLGDLSSVIPKTVIQSGKNTEHATQYMVFKGAALCVFNEAEAEQKWNTSVLKTLSGGDRMTGRLISGNYVSWAPTHTMVLATNHLPVVNFDEDAFWDRVAIVPFTRKFRDKGAVLEEGERYIDPRLSSTLQTPEEQLAILAWLIEGARLYNEEGGLERTPLIREQTRSARMNSNLATVFMAEMFEVEPDKGASIEAQTLFKMWVEYRNENSSLRRISPATERGIQPLAESFGAEYTKNAKGGQRAAVHGLVLTDLGVDFVKKHSSFSEWANTIRAIYPDRFNPS